MDKEISVNFKVKSPNGFEHQITLRNGATEEDFADLMTLISKKEKTLLDKGFTPVVYQSKGFAKKEPEYVDGRVCPTCNNKLVYALKRDGTKFIKCSTNKYINGQATGCPFVDWGDKPKVPERQVSEEDYGDY